MNNKAVFLDLQGTLGGEGLGDIMDFEFFSYSIEAIKLLNKNGILAIVVTNQSHIAKGILVRTGVGERSLTDFRDTWSEVEPAYIADNILEAIKWILRKKF